MPRNYLIRFAERTCLTAIPPRKNGTLASDHVVEEVEPEGVEAGGALGAAAGVLEPLSLDLESVLESALDSVDGESFFDSVLDSAVGAELLPA
jgi:hypothetical protein